MTRARLPGPARGLAIGLFGGSFNPAHDGHRMVAETALKRLRLDAVWFIVARGNPLKAQHGDFTERLASAGRLARNPKLHVTDIENRLGLTYSIDTIRMLQDSVPTARFIWIMGADNLHGFHRWKDWQDIARRLPIAVIARPGARISKASAFARKFAQARIPERDAASLAGRPAPAWVYLRVRENAISSTVLRTGA